MKSTIMKKNTHIKERYSSHQEVAEESLTSILPPERAGRKRERDCGLAAGHHLSERFSSISSPLLFSLQ